MEEFAGSRGYFRRRDWACCDRYRHARLASVAKRRKLGRQYDEYGLCGRASAIVVEQNASRSDAVDGSDFEGQLSAG